jgi:hypothetical protein
MRIRGTYQKGVLQRLKTIRQKQVLPYAYCLNNPVNAIDPDGRKIVFVNGYLGFGSPEGGSSYWGGTNSSFVSGAKSFFNDNAIPFFTNYDFSIWTSVDTRRDAGYSYAKENYEQLISGMDRKKDVFRIISHSMGGIFSDGIMKYLKEQGWGVEAAVHLNAWEPDKIQSWSDTNIIDATITNDWVQGLGLSATTNSRDIPNVDFRIRKESEKGYQYRHRDLIDNGDLWNTNSGLTWNQSMSLLQSWLQENPNIKVSYGQ